MARTIHLPHTNELNEVRRVLELIQSDGSNHLENSVKLLKQEMTKAIAEATAPVETPTKTVPEPDEDPFIMQPSEKRIDVDPYNNTQYSKPADVDPYTSDRTYKAADVDPFLDITRSSAPIDSPVFRNKITTPQTQYSTVNVIPTGLAGDTYWDAAALTLATTLNSSVTLQHGQEMHVRCVNKSGASISDGSTVYIDTAQGNRPTIKLARADSLTTSEVIGVATETIADNAEGYVTVFGVVNGFNTTAFAAGDEMHLSASSAGSLQAGVPAAPNYHVMVATALNSTNNGSIFVHPEPPLAQDTAFTANSPMVAPTQQAVKAFVDTKLSRIPSTQAVTSAATVTPAATDDLVTITAQAVPITLANPAGSPSQGQKLIIRLKDNGTARGISYGTQYRAMGNALPTTTVSSKTTYFGLIFNSSDTKWDLVALAQEA